MEHIDAQDEADKREAALSIVNKYLEDDSLACLDLFSESYEDFDKMLKEVNKLIRKSPLIDKLVDRCLESHSLSIQMRIDDA